MEGEKNFICDCGNLIVKGKGKSNILDGLDKCPVCGAWIGPTIRRTAQDLLEKSPTYFGSPKNQRVILDILKGR